MSCVWCCCRLPRRPMVTKHARRTSGVPLRVNCSCATRKQLRGPLLSVRECVAVYRFGIGYSQVDSKRIGALGYSMGSFVLSLTCAVDDRIHACVLAGGGNLDGPGGYWDGSKPMCQGIPYESLSFLGDRAAVIYTLHAF